MLSYGDAKSVLHVAPSEKGIVRRFERLPSYDPVDLFPDLYPDTDTKRLDLMAFAAEERYDLVYLSHVMEHVPDDRQVLRNLYQSLKPGGQAWILVPLWKDPTRDADGEMTAREREQAFGQWDHMRQYGPDLEQRLERTGFDVTIIQASESDHDSIYRLGLDDRDWIFCGTKA